MKTRTYYLVCAFLAIAMTPSIAIGQDFVFNVQIEVAELLPDARPVITCIVFKDNQIIGAGVRGKSDTRPDRIINRGSFQRVQVRFNAEPGKDPGSANRYECRLEVGILREDSTLGVGTKYRVDGHEQPSYEAFRDYYKAKAGTELVTLLRGQL